MVGSFSWRDSSSPRVGFGFGFCGSGEGSLDGGDEGVGGRCGEGPRGDGGEGDCFGTWNFLRIVIGVVPNWFRVSRAQPNVLLTDGGDVIDMGCGAGLGSGFVNIAGDAIVASLGVTGLVTTSFRSYADSIGWGSVGLGVGSAWNMRLCRSSLQYRSNGVDCCGSSSLLTRATGSTRIAFWIGGVGGCSTLIGVWVGSG